MAGNDIIDWIDIHEAVKNENIRSLGIGVLKFPDNLYLRLQFAIKLLELCNESIQCDEFKDENLGLLNGLKLEIPFIINEMGFKKKAIALMDRWRHKEHLIKIRRRLNVAESIGIGSDVSDEEENMKICLKTKDAMKKPKKASVCQYCGIIGISKRCTGGCSVTYCSKRCQKHDWKQHRLLCPKYAKYKVNGLHQCSLVRRLFELSEYFES